MKGESKLLRGIAGWFLDLGQPCYPNSPSTPSVSRTNEQLYTEREFPFVVLEIPRASNVLQLSRGRKEKLEIMLPPIILSFTCLPSFVDAINPPSSYVITRSVSIHNFNVFFFFGRDFLETLKFKIDLYPFQERIVPSFFSSFT